MRTAISPSLALQPPMVTSDMALKSLMCGVLSYCTAEISGRKGSTDSFASRVVSLEHDEDGGDDLVTPVAWVLVGDDPQRELRAPLKSRSLSQENHAAWGIA